MRRAALLAVFGVLFAAAEPLNAESVTRRDLSGVRRWAAFYGHILSRKAWDSLDLAVVDPDGFVVPKSSGSASDLNSIRRISAAYVSVGEADDRRPFWGDIQDEKYIIEPNPDWPSAHRVDIRDLKWRKLIVDKVVSNALAQGYDGVMLDTIDTAQYFESSAPARFAGSMAAAVSLVKELRTRYPSMVLLVNNGLPLLDEIGEAIDGVMVEDLYTFCLPQSAECVKTKKQIMREKEEVLLAFKEKTKKPVFVFIYIELLKRDGRLARWAVKRARKLGFVPYLSGASLELLGDVDPHRKK